MSLTSVRSALGVALGHVPEDGWRRAVLQSLPMAGVAFLVGTLMDGASGQLTPFDRICYPLLTIAVMVLELLLWRLPAMTNTVITAIVMSMSTFFLSKLIYILNVMSSTFSVTAQMTQSFFWIPAVYVLSFFVPNLRLARSTSAIFFTAMLITSIVYVFHHPPSADYKSVLFALIELNLSNLTLLALTNAFIGFKERYVRSETHTETLQRLAYSDLLTDLPNRLHLDQVLGEAANRPDSFSVLFIDMDGFKLVNDTLGHAAGDEVLREIGRRLQSVIGRTDTAARLSGDEFVIVMQGVASNAAAEQAQAVLNDLNRPYHVQGQIVHLSASIGISSFPQDSSDPAMVLRHADSAMYHIKASSKNGIRRFEASLDTEIERQKVMEREFQFALKSGELHLMFHPIYALGTGEIRKVETLLRWTRPAYGAVSPTVFIPIAEASAQIISVGSWVLHEACRHAATWQHLTSKPPVVTVNVSPLQFAQAGFVDTVREALSSSGLPPQQLELELTEGVVLKSVTMVQKVLAELREMGVHISIDDFGTGYSSLSYLKDLPITCIKIDRSFITDLESVDTAPQFALALIAAIVAIARTMNLDVVAEGIETPAQQALLLELGCHLGQGFLYSRPVLPEALHHTLETSGLFSPRLTLPVIPTSA